MEFGKEKKCTIPSLILILLSSSTSSDPKTKIKTSHISHLSTFSPPLAHSS